MHRHRKSSDLPSDGLPEVPAVAGDSRRRLLAAISRILASRRAIALSAADGRAAAGRDHQVEWALRLMS